MKIDNQRGFYEKKRFPYDPSAPAYVPGEFLVTFKPSVSEEAINEINAQYGVSVKETIPCAPDHKVLSVPTGKTVEEMVSIYGGLPEVKYAEPNVIGHITPGRVSVMDE